MKLKSLLIGGVALATVLIAANAQVPGVNSTLNSVFTLAYEVSTMKATYSATVASSAAQSSATDVCGLTGSATKQIRLRRVIVNGNASGAVTEPISIVKRSTLNTGNGAAIPAIAYDSNSPAATAVADVWTANPTVGTAVGTLVDLPVSFPTTTSASSTVEFDFGKLGSPVILRGATQEVAVNLSGITISGGVISCTFEWTEE